MAEIRPYFFDQTPEDLERLLADWGLPRFRARQVLEWVYQKHMADPALLANLSKKDRQILAERLLFTKGTVVRHLVATDGTQKLLLDWSASVPPATLLQTECVLIPAEDGVRQRRTVCVSSQVGCPVGCRFCASGLGGLDANLSAGQIVEQVWRLGSLPGVGRITNVVFMGMGEPLANFDQVTAAIRVLNADWGLGISARRITVSTVGLPAQIRRLTELDLPVTLAISLHAPNDQIRRAIIPWAKFVTIDQLIDAGHFYFEKTGREVTLEYVLLHGVNDQPAHAAELATVAQQLRGNVNLIRYNEVDVLPFQRPDDRDVRRFEQILKKAGVNVHIRASRGRDIAAACGQLRHEQNKAAASQTLNEP